MTRLIFVGWLFSLGAAFHLGWWGRHRLTQKIKKDCLRAIEEAQSLNASPSVIRKMWFAYLESM